MLNSTEIELPDNIKAYILDGRRKGKRYLAQGNRLLIIRTGSRLKFPLFNKGANRGRIIVEEKYKRNNPYGRLAYRTMIYKHRRGVGVGIVGNLGLFERNAGTSNCSKDARREWIPVNTNQNIARRTDIILGQQLM